MAKMNHQVSDQGFYLPSPSCMQAQIFTFDTAAASPPRSPFMDVKLSDFTHPMDFCPIEVSTPTLTCSPRVKSEPAPFPLLAVPRPPRNSCAVQALSIGKTLLKEVRSSCRQTEAGPSTASHILTDSLDFPPPLTHVGLSESFDDVIDYISTSSDATASNTSGYDSLIDDAPPVGWMLLPVNKENRPPVNRPQKLTSRSRPHACDYCPKTFTQRSTLKAHIRTHTGEKPYSCSVCHRAFADYSTWRKHVRLHTGEKPYVCGVCGKGFAQSGNMIRHRDTHLKKKVAC